MNKILVLTVMAICSALLWSCEKFLDVKPYNSLSHPNSLKDLRAMLDHEWDLTGWYPGLDELASDDFLITYTGFSKMRPYMQEAYIWEDTGLSSGIWTYGYKVISIANAVLEGLDRVDGGDASLRAEIKGEALFLRGWAFFNLAQIYCVPYSVLGQVAGKGLVLRLDSDSKVTLPRSSLEDTYQQIFTDLLSAEKLLTNRSQYLTRSSRLVVLAALARAYHTIEDYVKAEEMVDKVMGIDNRLLDFNDLDATRALPLNVQNNIEIFNFADTRATDYLLTDASTVVAAELYQSYEENDLRRFVFFERIGGEIKFKGFYHGRRSTFCGLAQDEMYLIKSECLARSGDLEQGTFYLTHLLEKRYDKNNFEPVSFVNVEALLDRVLLERRKELICRGVRWLDLRRLNRYPERAKVLERKFSDLSGGQIYQLPPNDLRYTFLIPLDAIDVGGYIQNER